MSGMYITIFILGLKERRISLSYLNAVEGEVVKYALVFRTEK